MISLKGLIFDEDHLLLKIKEDDYIHLKNDGIIEIDKKNDIYNLNDYDYCLVCYWPEWIDIYENDKSFPWLLNHILISQVINNNYKLIIETISNKSLITLVDEEFEKMPHEEKFFDINKYKIRKIYENEDDYEYGFILLTENTKEFIGLFSGCSCGYLECASDFGYIKDYELLIYAKSEGGEFFYISLFPKYQNKS